MSKIGRKPIQIGSVKVEIKGQEVHYQGPKNSGVYVLPEELKAVLSDDKLKLEPSKVGNQKDVNQSWGLHRALLANKIHGAQSEFEKKIQINGLGFKAALSGSKIVFTLGFSHKIDFVLPETVKMEVDKTGQKLVFKSVDRELLGKVCSMVRALRPPEPYKATGIKYEQEVIVRKSGKTKAA